MKHMITLTQRNIQLFLRDRLAVFFSFLSTIILVMLYFLFIAKMYVQSIEVVAADLFTTKAASFVIYVQMMAGVLILNSMSLTIGVFSTVAKDFETRRIDNLLLTPLRTWELLVSYLAAAFIVSFALNLFTWALSVLLIGALTGFFLSFGTVMLGVAILVFASAVSCAIMLLVTTLVRSSTAIGVFGGIAGSFLGFLCGIYMPFSNLGKGTEAAGSLLPYTHLTILLKRTLLTDALGQLDLPAEVSGHIMSDFFSAKNIGLCGADVPFAVMLTLCGVFAAASLVAAWLLLKKRIAKGQSK